MGKAWTEGEIMMGQEEQSNMRMNRRWGTGGREEEGFPQKWVQRTSAEHCSCQPS